MAEDVPRGGWIDWPSVTGFIFVLGALISFLMWAGDRHWLPLEKAKPLQDHVLLSPGRMAEVKNRLRLVADDAKEARANIEKRVEESETLIENLRTNIQTIKQRQAAQGDNQRAMIQLLEDIKKGGK